MQRLSPWSTEACFFRIKVGEEAGKRKRAGNDGKRKEKHATATRQGGGPQVGEVIRFGWVTRLLISSLIFITFT